MENVPREAGKSSFGLIEREIFLAALPIEDVGLILDVGCGIGNYSFALASHYPPSVRIKGVDLWKEGVKELNARAADLGVGNLSAVCGSAAHLPEVNDGQADLLLMGTVVHDLVERGAEGPALVEAQRVLRRKGTLAVVEFKKDDVKPGPPLAIRLSPGELKAIIHQASFTEIESIDLGQHCYLSLFRRD